MRLLGAALSATAVGLACLAAATAVAQTGAPAPETLPVSESDATGALEARRKVLFARMLERPDDLDAAFEYAGLSVQVGDLEGAIATLERMLIFAPGLPRLQLELGVLYFRLGSYGSARAYFDAAVSGPSVPPEVREKVDIYLSAIDTRSRPTGFSGAVLMGLRYQSNANAAPTSRTVTLNGVDFLLDESATGEPDFNGFATASLHFSHDLESQGDRFEANLLAYGALYAERHEINTGLADLTFGPSLNLERIGLEDMALGVYGILSGVILEEDPYLGAYGAGTSLVGNLGPKTRFYSKSEYRREEFWNSDRRPTASDRSGHRFRGIGGVRHQLSDRFEIFAGLEGERRFAERDFQSAWELGTLVGGAIWFDSPLPQQSDLWSFALSGGFIHREYDEPDPAINALESEEDEEAYVLGTLTIPIADGWALVTQGGYRNVESNYDTRDFDNAHGSVGAMKRF